jgi:hypothetical protein
MKRKNIQDERVSAERRKIASESFGILMMVLFGSILVQEFLLNAPFEQYAVEFICFLGILIYVILRYLTLGLNIYGEGESAKSSPLVTSIVAGIAITAINGVLNYMKYAERYQEDGIGYFIAMLVVTFISATIFAFVLLSCVNYLNKRKQAKIQKQLDEDEQGE